MSIIRLKHKGQVTIPASIRSELKLAEGDMLEANVAKGRIVLSPKLLVDRRVETAIAEGLADVSAGRMTPAFESVAAFRAHRRAARTRQPARKK